MPPCRRSAKFWAGEGGNRVVLAALHNVLRLVDKDLPDITVVTPVFGEAGALAFFVASRGHHADVGGIAPGSMPPFARSLAEEGIVLQLLIDVHHLGDAARGLFGPELCLDNRLFFLLFLAHGFAFEHGICDLGDQQLDGTDGIIVGRNDIVNVLRVAVGIHQGNDRDIQQIRFTDCRFFTPDIDDEEQIGSAFHRPGARKTCGETGDLTTDQQTFFLGQTIQLAGVTHLLEALEFLKPLRPGRGEGIRESAEAFNRGYFVFYAIGLTACGVPMGLLVGFVIGFFEEGKPVAAICHGPWTLVEADMVRDRTLTSYPSLQTDVRNAGGNWVDQEVCVDGGLVTSRRPADLEAFCVKVVEEIAEGKVAVETVEE